MERGSIYGQTDEMLWSPRRRLPEGLVGPAWRGLAASNRPHSLLNLLIKNAWELSAGYLLVNSGRKLLAAAIPTPTASHFGSPHHLFFFQVRVEQGNDGRFQAHNYYISTLPGLIFVQ